MRSKRIFAEGFIRIAFIVLSLHWFLVSPLDAMSPGSTLPGLQIPLPNSPEIKAYLGVKGAQTFSLSQVPAKLLVVEFFDVFCLVCQKDAPILNRLFKFIQEDQDLSKNIKMAGFALGSDPKDLAIFRQKYKVEFPLFPDPQKQVQTASKVTAVPLIVVANKSGKVLMSHRGLIENLDAFLVELRKHYKAQ
jgi:peroxiredoxin